MESFVAKMPNIGRECLGLAVAAGLLLASCGKSPPAQPSQLPSPSETTVKAPAPTAPPEPPPTQLTQPRFAVQAGAFKSRARAEALSLRLSGRYQRTILVSPVEMSGRTLYRVRILVETKAEARSMASSLAQIENLGAWIVASTPEKTAKAPASALSAVQPPTQPAKFHFAVQAAAFKYRSQADALSLRLSGRYQRATLVTPAQVNGQTFYRVRILVETKREAKSLVTSLEQTENIQPWIVTLT